MDNRLIIRADCSNFCLYTLTIALQLILTVQTLVCIHGRGRGSDADEAGRGRGSAADMAIDELAHADTARARTSGQERSLDADVPFDV